MAKFEFPPPIVVGKKEGKEKRDKKKKPTTCRKHIYYEKDEDTQTEREIGNVFANVDDDLGEEFLVSKCLTNKRVRVHLHCSRKFSYLESILANDVDLWVVTPLKSLAISITSPYFDYLN
uniref:Uncharacterized protein n=1 Tax=Cucumis melo TaxID=3656 RepID=A0A9I9E8E9_CUCME